MGVRPRGVASGFATFVRRKEGVVDTGDRLLTPGEVAALFRVDPKTVTRWAAAGRISSIRTPGGHRRFRESEVRALLEGEGEEAGGVEPTGHRVRHWNGSRRGSYRSPGGRGSRAPYWAESRGAIPPVHRVNSWCGTPSTSRTFPATKSTSCSAVAEAPAP